ncbi:MAG: hypothetical protein AB7U46_13495 [Paenirhodobacter sp.]|uniref:hypothetical protein n=1 Tax=Paenirhodobacter sp. TaxID=1965326 RepID=UPI003D0DAE53
MATTSSTDVSDTGTLPTTDEVIRAGINGAAIAAAWTAASEVMRVRNGECTTQEALQTTVNSAVIGAGAGAVASAASHVARAMPIWGLALVVLGAGAVYLSGKPRAPSAVAASGSATPREEG